MRVQTIDIPAHTAILLDEVKDHLRIDGAEEDAALGALVAAATSVIESHLDLALVNRTVKLHLNHWVGPGNSDAEAPWWNGVADGAISMVQPETYHVALPVKPLQSISAVEITVAGGSTVEWGADNYYLKPGLTPALVRKYGRAWPVPGIAVDGIKITAVAGFGPDWNHVPASLRQALLMLVTHLYYNRGDAEAANSLKASGAEALLAVYRGMRL